MARSRRSQMRRRIAFRSSCTHARPGVTSTTLKTFRRAALERRRRLVRADSLHFVSCLPLYSGEKSRLAVLHRGGWDGYLRQTHTGQHSVQIGRRSHGDVWVASCRSKGATGLLVGGWATWRQRQRQRCDGGSAADLRAPGSARFSGPTLIGRLIGRQPGQLARTASSRPQQPHAARRTPTVPLPPRARALHGAERLGRRRCAAGRVLHRVSASQQPAPWPLDDAAD